jgi:hypothetical protein
MTILGPDGKPARIQPPPNPEKFQLDLSLWCDVHRQPVEAGMLEGTMDGPEATFALLREFGLHPQIQASVRRIVRSDPRLRPAQALVGLAMQMKPLCCRVDHAWRERAYEAGKTVARRRC